MEITRKNIDSIVDATCNELVSEIANNKVISKEDLKTKAKVFFTIAIKKRVF